MNFDQMLQELKRRRVFRVAGAYAVVAWLAIQVAEVSFEAFDVPDWGMRLVILLALLGFPVAVALAWAFDLTPGGLERTAAPGETGPVPPGGGRPRALIAGIVALAGIAAAWLTFSRVSGGEIEGDPRKSVVVFPFENTTGAAEWRYLEDASSNMLGLALSHWTDMRVFDDERTGSLLRRKGVESAGEIDFDTARDLAAEIGFGTFVIGDFRVEGDSLTIEAKVYDTASGERIGTETARLAREGDPRRPFGALAAGILEISGAPPGERPDLLAQTTSSLEAYRAYVEGLQALQQFDIPTAAAALRRATEIDTTFALAYLKRRDVDGWAGIESDPEQRRIWVAKAVQHSEGLPPRYAALVRYHEAYSTGRYEEAREIASAMIARDSTDAEAWYQLGEAHFHDAPGRAPRVQPQGDFHAALDAFRRTLELEPGYVLAYQHVLDVLGSCVGNNPWVCFEDRTVYGPRDSLATEFGADVIAGERERAAVERLEAGRAWVSAAPGSVRAHQALMGLLVDGGRLDEAERHLSVMRAQGQGDLAAVWESRLQYARQDYAAAARTLVAAVDSLGGPRVIALTDPDRFIVILTAGGRPATAGDMFNAFISQIPADSVAGPDAIMYGRERFREYVEVMIRALGGQEVENLSGLAHAWLEALDADYEPGTPPHELRWLESGPTILGAYIATGDSTLLARYTAAGDTARSRTWRVLDAFLALERGRPDAARAAIDRWFEGRDEIELRGDPGAMRLLGWGHLYERLGEPERAVEAWALFDTEDSANLYAALRVRAWYERARVLETLGEHDRAIENYERFVTAWADGDESVQPLVEDVRAALARLRDGP